MFRPTTHCLLRQDAVPQCSAGGGRGMRGDEPAMGDVTADAAGDAGSQGEKSASLELPNARSTDPQVTGTLCTYKAVIFYLRTRTGPSYEATEDRPRAWRAVGHKDFVWAGTTTWHAHR